MTVDLRNVSFADRSLSVSASVGVGQLVVEVPPGVVVDLTAQSGSSGISYPNGEKQFFVTSRSRSPKAKLDLTVRTGIGDVLLIRSAPGSALY